MSDFDEPAKVAPVPSRRSWLPVAIPLLAVGTGLMALSVWLFLSASETSQRVQDIRERMALCAPSGKAAKAKLSATSSTPPSAAAATPEDAVDVDAVTQTFAQGVFPKGLFDIKIESMARDDTAVGWYVTEPKPLGLWVNRSQVTLVNLWASWCGPCKKELPQFGIALADPGLARKVQLIAINSNDTKNPVSNALEFGKKLPPDALMLVDRSSEVHVTDVLQGKELYRGELPLTFVMDCRRRVRWVNFGELAGKSMDELAVQLRTLVGELGGPECRTAICGNELCEAGESPGSCPSDCCRDGADDPACSDYRKAEPACGRCGDRKCQPECSETKKACWDDCHCGDHICDSGESVSCPRDCKSCGDGVCQQQTESFDSCPKDCRRDGGSTGAAVARCGDRICASRAGENCVTCAKDCGCANGESCSPKGVCASSEM